MRTGLLLGREHQLLGGVAAIAEGRCAVALSLGGAKKLYEHRDPNEDAAGFAEGEGGLLVLVADGHGGHQAAEVASLQLLSSAAERWTARDAIGLRERWLEEASEVLHECNTAILDGAARDGPEASRTTLAFALLRPRDDLLAFASMGDSHLFHAGAIEVVDLAFDAKRQGFFLGFPSETRESLRERSVCGCEALRGTRAVLLASDGLSERGIGVDHPEAVIAECVAAAARARLPLRALEAARGVAEAAVAAQRRQRSGDNVASAVAWYGDGA
jgi:serine/threonine protein phosphatase PrpC